jgi:hypothetical protein
VPDVRSTELGDAAALPPPPGSDHWTLQILGTVASGLLPAAQLRPVGRWDVRLETTETAAMVEEGVFCGPQLDAGDPPDDQ